MRPFTGKEFLDSLRDGREIWIYGQRVPDVTAHPAFRNPARMVARLYDALHDAASRVQPWSMARGKKPESLKNVAAFWTSS